MVAKKGKKGKKVAAAPLAVKRPEAKRVVNPLFEKRSRNFGIGADIQPPRDLTRFKIPFCLVPNTLFSCAKYLFFLWQNTLFSCAKYLILL